MRYSIEKSDPGFAAYDRLMRQSKRLQIYLNGVRQRDLLTCDDQEGFVLRQVRDGRGRLQVERGKVRTMTLRGKVEFVITDSQGIRDLTRHGEESKAQEAQAGTGPRAATAV